MGIPSKISPLTGGDILPRGYIAAEFLTSNLKEYIDTGIILNQDSEVDLVFQPNSVYEDGYLLGSRVSSTEDAMCFYAATPGNTFFNYNTEVPIVIVNMTKSALGVLKIRGPEWHVSYDMGDGTVREASRTFDKQSFSTPSSCYLMAYNLVDGNVKKGFTGNVYSLRITNPGGSKGVFIPAISASGEPCMFDIVSRKTCYNIGTGAFGVGMTVSQARYLCKLPIVESGALTVSLPWEAQYDTGVQAALSIAATNGWTITVQYRDPEVATTNIPIGFLESTGAQRIDAGLRYSSNDTYSQTLDLSITDKNHAGNTGVNYLGWCSVKNGTYYMLNETPNAPIGERDIIYNKFLNKERFLYVNGSEVTRHAEQSAVSDIIAGIFALGNVNSAWWWETNKNIKAKLYSAKFTKNDVLARDMLPALDSTGTPCLYDRVTKQTFYNNGTGAFIAGFNTIEQSMKLATLPDVTAETDVAKKSLTVSLPWEAQLIASGVPAALQVAADRGWTITVQYRDPEADNVYYNKYATCTTVNDMKAVNPNYKTDLTAAGEWIYPLPLISNARDMLCENSKLTAVSVNLPMCTNAIYAFAYCSNLKSFSGSLPVLQNGYEMFNNSRQFKLFDASVPALSNGQRMFNYCILDKGSALNVLNSIPTYTSGSHLLTIGIHIDHQNDEEVLTAIADAEAKGWTVTVQWNGTATAAAASVSTFGLRSPSIYAKLGTVERPDGTTENVLDWGHYVTNWEENGYQEFSSIEEAEEHFNINQTEEL